MAQTPSKQDLAAIVLRKLSRHPQYHEALAIVQANARGDIWLIGGIVSRVLLEELYHIPQETYDFDFLVEHVAEDLSIPSGWECQRKKHGNPTFIKEGLEIDLFPIATHHFIRSHNLSPTIEHFFQGVPFTIQAMALNIRTGELLGDIGIRALLQREYAVNNREEAQIMADAKGITINDRILKKAKSLGLTPVLLTS